MPQRPPCYTHTTAREAEAETTNSRHGSHSNGKWQYMQNKMAKEKLP